MAIPLFTPTENYLAFKILRQVHLNALAASVKTQFDTHTKLNFDQIGKDVFGNTYAFNSDGLATLVTPLIDLVAQLAQNEVVTGSWTYQGTVAFQAAVSSTSTFTSTGQHRARAYLSGANQTIPTGAATSINLNSESYDVGSLHDNAVNNSRIVVATGGGGIYQIHGQVTFAANAVGRRDVYIYKNGSKIAEARELGPIGGSNSILQVSCQDTGNASDYYEMVVFQDSGGNLDVVLGDKVTFFSAMKVW